MTIDYISAVDSQAVRVPNKVAFRNSRGQSITYAELKRQSDALACWIASNPEIPARVPIVVYGHKAPVMLVCFLACVKSGHAYAPVDVVYPRERIANIIGQLGDTVVLDTMSAIPGVLGDALQQPCFDADTIAQACAGSGENVADLPRVSGDDTYYIIFTSGSTGTPKGVEVSASNLDNFSAWFNESEYAVPEDRIWFNRAPFTFDLSVTDLAGGLPRGDTLFALEVEAEQSLAIIFEAFSTSEITDWVSTPSFLDQCLADEKFDASLLPTLKRMIFIGETLRPETVRKAFQRFPGLRVYNGYGPTESTDFVTLCEILPSMLEEDRSLPIGYVKEGTRLLVLDPETLEPVPDGEHGELFVIGNTVAKGYWRREDLTQAAFRSCPAELAQGEASYRTGDEGTRDASGMYYFHGRYDLQVKFHGYRIELGDIEATLCALPEVHMACVLPVWREGVISHLMAFIVPADLQAPRGFALTKSLKRAMRDAVPTYMVPRAFKYVDELPMNASGKADRKALAALIAE